MLEDDDTWISLLHPGKATLTLQGQKGRTVSVFPFGAPSCTLSYTGLEYPLERGTLKADQPVGISNVVTMPEAGDYPARWLCDCDADEKYFCLTRWNPKPLLCIYW